MKCFQKIKHTNWLVLYCTFFFFTIIISDSEQCVALLLLHNNLKEKLVSFIRKEGEGDMETADPYIVWKGTCFIEGEYDV